MRWPLPGERHGGHTEVQRLNRRMDACIHWPQEGLIASGKLVESRMPAGHFQLDTPEKPVSAGR